MVEQSSELEDTAATACRRVVLAPLLEVETTDEETETSPFVALEYRGRGPARTELAQVMSKSMSSMDSMLMTTLGLVHWLEEGSRNYYYYVPEDQLQRQQRQKQINERLR